MVKSSTKTSDKVSSNIKIKYMTSSAVLAALITVFTAFICHIPAGPNGGYIHFGDSLIYIAAVILPTPYALMAAAVGGGLADLLTAPMWAPATIIIKMLITIPFSNKSAKIVTWRNVIATVIAFIISGIGYFFAEAIIFGTEVAFLTSVSGSAVQSGGSAILFVILGIALDKMGFKKRIFSK